jgi:hypothetical protein
MSIQEPNENVDEQGGCRGASSDEDVGQINAPWSLRLKQRAEARKNPNDKAQATNSLLVGAEAQEDESDDYEDHSRQPRESKTQQRERTLVIIAVVERRDEVHKLPREL